VDARAKTDGLRLRAQARGTAANDAASRALDNLERAVRRAQARDDATASPTEVSEPNLIGRRAGRGRVNLEDALDDSTQEARSAHTARRNVKRSNAGMAYALEDSMTARPSRKSTRRATGRIKAATQLTRRTKRRVHAPQNRAAAR
jgi:hypothetical protein